MAVKDVTDATFDQEVLQAQGLVLVDFWAEWCGPCKAMSPVLDQVAGEFGGKIKVIKVNVDHNSQSPAKYNVRSIPSLMLFKGGQLVETKVGMVKKEDLKAWVESTLN